jgi:protein O-GlcNAc transferase
MAATPARSDDATAPATLVRLVDGTLVSVPDSPHFLTAYIVREQEDWFEEEIRFLRSLVQPGQRVIDIGANHGVYALSLARRVGPTGAVWAFEPAADTGSHLEAGIAANATPWLRLLRQALSDHEGIAWLRKPGQSELNSLAPPSASGAAASGVEGEAVPVTTLDACMDAWGWGEVDLLKMDAEGEEARILDGGQRFFQETSPLVMFELKEGARLHLELIERFANLGYRAFRLVPGLPALVPFASSAGVDGYQLNLFAAKPDRVAALAAAGWLVDEELESEPPDGAFTPATLVGEAMARLEGLPYGQALAERWRGAGQTPEATRHQEAIAAWTASQTLTLPLSERLAALRRSVGWLGELCQTEASAGRLASLARVAMDLGERERAVTALGQLVDQLQREGEAALREPFLAPHPAYDAIDPRGRLTDWLESAALEALESFSSFSSFFTGASALPRLQRLSALGLATPAMDRRRQLVQARFPQEPLSRAWFDSLALDRPIRCLDVGAMALGDTPEPWVRWAREGCAEVIGFEPLPDDCDKLNNQVAELRGRVRYLPVALGDGEEHTLHVTNAPMTSSLLPPDRATVDLFPFLGDLMRVVRQERVRTRRLDDLNDVRPVDFLKLDVQGAELMVLRHGTTTLADVTVVQCEVEFVELYAGQPLLADIDAFLRSQGFTFLRFTSLQGRPFAPLRRVENPMMPLSQTLWGDAVYVRDFRRRDQWSLRQLKAAAFVLHELYEAFDLVALLLAEVDRREQGSWQSLYLASLLLSDPTLQAD